MNETWEDIMDYEGMYQVSSLGRIKSISRLVKCRAGGFRKISERFLKSSKGTNGYCVVVLCLNNIDHTKNLHRLIASAFIPNPDNKPCINHINGIRSDNSLSNLEWCTYSENGIHSRDILKNNYISNSKIGTDTVKKIREMYSSGNYKQRELANVFSVSDATVYCIVNMKTWKNI